MKKVVIPVCVILVLFVGFIVFGISMRFNTIQFEKDMLAHVMAVNSGGELIAEYNGRTTRVLGSNIIRIQRVISVSERMRVFTKPKYDADGAVMLHYSDGADVIIAKDASASDSAFVLYSYKGKKLYFSIKGYKTLDWAVRAVSPEGIQEPNDLVESPAAD